MRTVIILSITGWLILGLTVFLFHNRIPYLDSSALVALLTYVYGEIQARMLEARMGEQLKALELARAQGAIQASRGERSRDK